MLLFDYTSMYGAISQDEVIYSLVFFCLLRSFRRCDRWVYFVWLLTLDRHNRRFYLINQPVSVQSVSSVTNQIEEFSFLSKYRLSIQEGQGTEQIVQRHQTSHHQTFAIISTETPNLIQIILMLPTSFWSRQDHCALSEPKEQNHYLAEEVFVWWSHSFRLGALHNFQILQIVGYNTQLSDSESQCFAHYRADQQRRSHKNFDQEESQACLFVPQTMFCDKNRSDMGNTATPWAGQDFFSSGKSIITRNKHWLCIYLCLWGICELLDRIFGQTTHSDWLTTFEHREKGHIASDLRALCGNLHKLSAKWKSGLQCCYVKWTVVWYLPIAKKQDSIYLCSLEWNVEAFFFKSNTCIWRRTSHVSSLITISWCAGLNRHKNKVKVL